MFSEGWIAIWIFHWNKTYLKISAVKWWPSCSSLTGLTPWGRVIHIYINKLGHIWFRSWFVTCMAPNHYLNYCWHIVNWILQNIFQWHSSQNTLVFIQENVLKMSVVKCCPSCAGLRVLTHLPLDKMAATLQMIYSDAFLWMKSFVFWLKFHWSLFHYLNHCWPYSLTHICVSGPQWVKGPELCPIWLLSIHMGCSPTAHMYTYWFW